MSSVVVPGAPCWFELTATDTAASEAYHTGLFGWDCAASTVPGVGRIARLDDPTGAGAYVIRLAMR